MYHLIYSSVSKNNLSDEELARQMQVHTLVLNYYICFISLRQGGFYDVHIM